MSKIPPANARIEKIKKQAKKLAKELVISHADALEKVALSEGFPTWFECRTTILKNPPPQDSRNTKIKKKPHNGKLRLSTLNYSDKEFESTNSLRNRLEREFKSIIKNSENFHSINVKLHINTDTAEMIGNTSSFFDSVLDRFDRISKFTVDVDDDYNGLAEFEALFGMTGKN